MDQSGQQGEEMTTEQTTPKYGRLIFRILIASGVSLFMTGIWWEYAPRIISKLFGTVGLG